MVQYYTLEQAAQILRVNPDQLKEMARKKEIRAFQDRSGWRFRAQEIDELARARGLGSDPELPLGEGGKAKAGDSGKEVFNFNLDADEGDEVALGKQPPGAEKGSSRAGAGSRKTGTSKSPPPKASSDSDVRLVMDGSDLDFTIEPNNDKPTGSKAPVSPPPKVGSSKSRMAPPAKEDSGVRIVPLDSPSDSDVKITQAPPHESEIDVAGQPAKKPSDSDIRIEELPRAGTRDQLVTEEIDLDAEERKAEAARAKSTRHRPKPGSSPVLPTNSPFELSEPDMKLPAARKGPRSPDKEPADTDSSSDFELKPLTDSSPLDPSSDELKALMADEEVSLGEITGPKGGSGINLQDPADSGISLESKSSDDLKARTPSGRTPKPASAKDAGTDSSSDFELSLQDDDSSPTDGGSSSEFELSLQDDADAGSSSEFELSLDSQAGLAGDEGSSDLALESPAADSDSEFELTLDESGGLSLDEDASSADSDVMETDFEVPSLEEGDDASALEDSDTGLESSEFDLSLEGEESGSQVVPLEDEEEYDEGAATVQRPKPELAAEEEGDLGEALDEDLDAVAAADEEPGQVVVTAAAPPAEWGVVAPVASLFCTIVLFIVGLMSFELIQGMWGYHKGTKVSNFLIHPIAKTLSGEENLPDN